MFALALLPALAQPPLHLVPTPKEVRIESGSCRLSDLSSIRVQLLGDTFDRLSADQLADELRAATGRRPRTSGTGSVVLARTLEEDLARRFGVSSQASDVPGAYVLAVRPGRALVWAPTAQGVFYGVQTFKQLIRAEARQGAIPCVTIRDWPSLRYRGWQDDVSRGPIPKLEFLKKEIDRFSELKMNAMTLYTEHVFRLEKHPRIAPPDGLTAEEIRELDAYAKLRHVELIGNFQSFGHFANILNVPGYGHLGEAGWVLSPALEESYRFLEDVYSEIAPAYSSPLFHINCDETGGLGEGPSRELVATKGLAAVYAGHIRRVAEILRRHGKRVMMWGDIAAQHRDIVPQLPKDLIALPWGYHPGDSFRSSIQPFVDLGLEFMVCPGVSCWGQIYPDLDAAFVNIANFVRDGAAMGALGMLNTSWDDSGENLFDATWLPFAWGAEMAWTPLAPDAASAEREARLGRFLEAFGLAWAGPAAKDLGPLLRRLSALRRNPASRGLGDGNFWKPLESLAGSAREEEIRTAQRECAALGEALGRIRSALPNADGLDAALHAVRRVAFMARTASLAERLRGIGNDPSALPSILSDVRARIAELRALREEYARLWSAENRPWWLDRNLAKFDRLEASLAQTLAGPILLPFDRIFAGEVEVRLVAADASQPIRYTLDGTDPGPASPAYSQPIRLSKTTTVKARVGDGPVVQATYRTTTVPARLSSNLSAYEGHVLFHVLDGDPGTFFWSFGPPPPGSHITAEFLRPIPVRRIRVLTGQPWNPSGDRMYDGVLEVSEGGQWAKVADFVDGTAEADLGGRVLDGVRVRSLRNPGFWLVVREILVESD